MTDIDILEINNLTGNYEKKMSSKWFRIKLKNGDTFDIIDKGGEIQIMTEGSMRIKPKSGNVIHLESVKL